MKPNRDMFYSNYQAGGFQEPNMIYTPPQGYSINQNYQAYGPNVMGSIPNNQVQNNQSKNKISLEQARKIALKQVDM